MQDKIFWPEKSLGKRSIMLLFHVKLLKALILMYKNINIYSKNTETNKEHIFPLLIFNILANLPNYNF